MATKKLLTFGDLSRRIIDFYFKILVFLKINTFNYYKIMQQSNKLVAIREHLVKHGLDAYLIPHNDAHDVINIKN